MEISINVDGQFCEIKPVGAISADSADAVFERFVQVSEEHGALDYVFNLEQVAYVDSAGLGMFVRVSKRLREKDGGRLVLIKLQKNVRQLFSITKLDEILPVRDE